MRPPEDDHPATGGQPLQRRPEHRSEHVEVAQALRAGHVDHHRAEPLRPQGVGHDLDRLVLQQPTDAGRERGVVNPREQDRSGDERVSRCIPTQGHGPRQAEP